MGGYVFDFDRQCSGSNGGWGIRLEKCLDSDFGYTLKNDKERTLEHAIKSQYLAWRAQS